VYTLDIYVQRANLICISNIYICTFIHIQYMYIYAHIHVCVCMRVCICMHVYVCVHACTSICMGWLRLVGSLKLQISFAEYGLFYRALLQKRPVILRSLLVDATPYIYVFWRGALLTGTTRGNPFSMCMCVCVCVCACVYVGGGDGGKGVRGKGGG